MNIKNPEILAPGGDFNSAIHALNNGADAVYLGLTSFSARKKAKNFTLDELRRLKTYAVQNSKKIYVAINTLLKDKELKDIFPIIKELELIQVDAVIIQDLGLAKLIKEHSNLIIHASTQLAIHNIHGIQILKDLGFARAVLSRELSLQEIIDIKKYAPEMELEIFIHGALCYGFSGLCLASSKLIGRSANRGECGQICRTWFNNSGKKEYCFSLNDLSLNEKVLKLKEIGIESLKIEGRMKGPGYAAATARLYFEILNNIEFSKSLKKSEVEFNRSGHDAYLQNTKGFNNINSNYPGHTGRKIAEIISQSKTSFWIKSEETIENRDGLMIFDKQKPPQPFRFAANIEEIKGDKYLLKAKLPEGCSSSVYLLSQHDRHLKEENSLKFKPWKSDVIVAINVLSDSIEITADSRLFRYSIELEEANNILDMQKIFNKSFYAGGDSAFHFPVTQVSNNSGFTAPYIQGSKLKIIRNNFQQEFINSREQEFLPLLKIQNILKKKYIRNSAQLPFITEFSNVNIDELESFEDSKLLPLSPVIFDSASYLKELKQYLKDHETISFIIGLNNLSHLSFIKELPENMEYYCDYGLYTLNQYSISYFSELIPNLKWVTEWIEKDKKSLYPPIFISRTCFKAQQDGCPQNCKKSFEYIISQNGKQKVIVKDCISYTFMESEPLE